jgi:hypothetical protein
MPKPDHLNDIERKLIDQLRTGTYVTASGDANAWSDGDVTVYGQFPDTTEVQYPALIVEHIANIGVDKASSITVDGEVYKERRLLNYLMLNCANVLMDTDFSSLTNTQVLERHYAGFREIAYVPELEIWTARTNMIITFKNER